MRHLLQRPMSTTMHDRHSPAPDFVCPDDQPNNTSANPHFAEVLQLVEEIVAAAARMGDVPAPFAQGLAALVRHYAVVS